MKSSPVAVDDLKVTSNTRRINDFNPNLYIDVTKTMSQRADAFKEYGIDRELADAQCYQWGKLAGSRYAEALEIVYLIE
ncbi:hypothetical protein FACS1894184_13140 [Clostridia bacterium]|nr:hypothetical protein FACS1894184_13140 [Clostridia bacterium]